MHEVQIAVHWANTAVLCDRNLHKFGDSWLQFHLQDGLHFGNGEMTICATANAVNNNVPTMLSIIPVFIYLFVCWFIWLVGWSVGRVVGWLVCLLVDWYNNTDWKRPGGLTLVPWQSGRSLCWDVTVTCPLAESYVTGSAREAGAAAELAASRKEEKYANICSQ